MNTTFTAIWKPMITSPATGFTPARLRRLDGFGTDRPAPSSAPWISSV
jgi:hypothetical protein